jgi:DNA-binding SARP family transcriptional activator
MKAAGAGIDIRSASIVPRCRGDLLCRRHIVVQLFLQAMTSATSAPAEIAFRLLGPLEVEVGGAALPLGGQKQRALLALLLIHAGEVVPTDRIVDELWSERPPKTATTSLQNFVAQLRKVLPADLLVTRSPGYLLRVSSDLIDAGRFEQLVRKARAEDAAGRAATLREALDLWRGSPLADFAYEQFALGEIRRLTELRLDVIEERIDAELDLGAGGELVAELEGLVTGQPLRERLRGQLMLALYRAGRQAEALQSYHDARHALVEELGVEPGPALQQLYRSILRQEGALERAKAAEPVDDHIGDVARALLAGRLVLVLGPAANRGGESGKEPVPGPEEVVAHLARVFDCPRVHARDLAHVAEWVAVAKGAGPLYDELHALFHRGAPGPVHRAMAELAAVARSHDAPPQLLLTTGFDRLLEQAFAEANEELDVVLYLAFGRHRGKFLHLGADGGLHSRRDPERLHRLHRLSRPGGHLRRASGDPGGEAAPEPFPLPRVPARRVEPARLSPPHVRAREGRIPLVGGRICR